MITRTIASLAVFALASAAVAAGCGSSLSERKPIAQEVIAQQPSEDAGAKEATKPATPCEAVARRTLACPDEQSFARSVEECEQHTACLGKKGNLSAYVECARTNATDCAKTCDVMAIATKDQLEKCNVLEPATKVEPGKPGAPAKSLSGPACPSKATKGSMSNLAMKTCNPKGVREKSKVIGEIRQIETALAGGTLKEREVALVTFRLAKEYAELECILSIECLRGKPDALNGEIPFSDARLKTESNCATLRSTFPKFAGQCS